MSADPVSPISDDPHAPHPEGCTCLACASHGPVPGDVVLAAVPPRHGARGCPAPTPCLVLDVEETDDGARRALLLPGAPATGRRAGRLDVYATADDLHDVRGLDRPHVFTAGRSLLVPLGGAGSGAEAGPMTLGRLDGRARDRLGALRRRLRAEPGTRGTTPVATAPTRTPRLGTAPDASS